MSNKKLQIDPKKKEAFIRAWIKSFGNISQACDAAGISRQTYYRWINNKDFKKVLDSEEVEERFIDFLEAKLTSKINKDDTTALIFALKTKGKKRGYVEKQEIEHKGEMKHNLIEWKPAQ